MLTHYVIQDNRIHSKFPKNRYIDDNRCIMANSSSVLVKQNGLFTLEKRITLTHYY